MVEDIRKLRAQFARLRLIKEFLEHKSTNVPKAVGLDFIDVISNIGSQVGENLLFLSSNIPVWGSGYDAEVLRLKVSQAISYLLLNTEASWPRNKRI